MGAGAVLVLVQEARKPNVVAAPGASCPFQPAFRTVTEEPFALSVPPHSWVIR